MENQALQELICLRREFHQCAEIGWLEYETTIRIIQYLKSFGLEVIYGKQIHSERIGLPEKDLMEEHKKGIIDLHVDFDTQEILEGYTGAIGVLNTQRPGPTIALRFDIDSNGIEEDTKEVHKPYREKFISKNKGMMHACGHDGHIAMGLLLAKKLSNAKEQLSGKILFLFQPAEEGVRGAKSFVDAGVLEDVDYIFSGHIGFMAKKNQVICGVGGFLATTKLDIHYYGRPSHAGAYPELGKNALLAGASCALNLHTLPQFSEGMSRINVGIFQAGTARNVVPSYAKLEVEIRGETQEINDKLLEKAYHIIEGSAKLYDIEYQVKKVGGAPAYHPQQDKFTAYVMDLLHKHDFEILQNASLGGSEDVTYMFNEVEKNGGKALYMVFGTTLKAPHHHSSFDFDEEVLVNGYICYQDIVLDLLSKAKRS
ncbi:amidohydrolase [Clostridiaceae bacterium 35-E11]